MSTASITTVRRYLECLHASDTEGLIALFAPEGRVMSPFLGAMDARPFFTKLAQSSMQSVITLIDLFESVTDGARRVAAYFRYDWTLKDGQVITFTCVDVFELDGDARITTMTILYDTHPIRETVGDKYA